MGGKADIVPVDKLEALIHVIRGRKVLLDRDLAALYGVETRALNQAVRRNIDRFPNDFMFPLSRDEIRRISQIVTSSDVRFSKRVHVFTEQGVAMLSSVLRSPRAIRVNIGIMRAFVRMRQLIAANAELGQRVAELEKTCDKQFKVVFDALRKLIAPPKEPPQESRREIGFHTLRDSARPVRIARWRAAPAAPVRY